MTARLNEHEAHLDDRETTIAILNLQNALVYEGACTMAVPAMRTRPRTSALRMHSAHPAIRNANHMYKYLRQLSMNGPYKG